MANNQQCHVSYMTQADLGLSTAWADGILLMKAQHHAVYVPEKQRRGEEKTPCISLCREYCARRWRSAPRRRSQKSGAKRLRFNAGTARRRNVKPPTRHLYAYSRNEREGGRKENELPKVVAQNILYGKRVRMAQITLALKKNEAR